MGNQWTQGSKKVIALENVPDKIQKCLKISQRKCSVYGDLHRIYYEGQQFQIAKTTNSSIPTPYQLHYLVPPNIILLPSHQLLQNFKFTQYQSKKQLISIIAGICQLERFVDVGFSNNRVALNKSIHKWCVMGDSGNGFWNYQHFLKNPKSTDVYFSPQLMESLSKDKLYPKINIKQSDMFVFAIMLLEIICEQKLQTQIYNFQTFQIRLKPILDALLIAEDKFGQNFYNLLLKMLEFKPQQRITFEQLLKNISQIIKIEQTYLSPAISKVNIFTPSPNIKLKNDSCSPSPHLKTNVQQKVIRGRSPGVIKKNFQAFENKKSFSPIKKSSNENLQAEDQQNQKKPKRVSHGYKITPNKVKLWQGMDKDRPSVQPFGFRQEGQGEEGQKKYFSKLKNIRF